MHPFLTRTAKVKCEGLILSTTLSSHLGLHPPQTACALRSAVSAVNFLPAKTCCSEWNVTNVAQQMHLTPTWRGCRRFDPAGSFLMSYIKFEKLTQRRGNAKTEMQNAYLNHSLAAPETLHRADEPVEGSVSRDGSCRAHFFFFIKARISGDGGPCTVGERERGEVWLGGQRGCWEVSPSALDLAALAVSRSPALHPPRGSDGSCSSASDQEALPCC